MNTDQFHRERLLGKGTTGEVYLVRDRKSQTLYAMKAYQQSYANEEFMLEYELLKRLSHRGIPKVVGKDDKQGCIFMEYVHGTTLEHLTRTRPLTREEVRQWMLEIRDIFIYLEDRYPIIVFRDLKPSNLMITRLGHVKLIDFGGATEVRYNRGEPDNRITKPWGTVGFAAPEQYQKGSIDHRVDIYAFGATFYYAMTGRHYDLKDPIQNKKGIRHIKGHYGRKIWRILEKCLKEDPEQRWQVAEEMMC